MSNISMFAIAMLGMNLVAQSTSNLTVSSSEEQPKNIKQNLEYAYKDKIKNYCNVCWNQGKFGAYVQGLAPMMELKERLNKSSGYGVGVQWLSKPGHRTMGRTRLEWNSFPENVSSESTFFAKNYILSKDQLFALNQGRNQAYVLAGIGGARWCLEQTSLDGCRSRWITKLALSGGLGIQMAENMNLETRYVVSSVDKTMDSNTAQMVLGWKF